MGKIKTISFILNININTFKIPQKIESLAVIDTLNERMYTAIQFMISSNFLCWNYLLV